MFDQIEPTNRWLSPRLAVWLAVLAAFNLGMFVGQLTTGHKPHDWALTGGNVAMAFVFLVWALLSATRKTKQTSGSK